MSAEEFDVIVVGSGAAGMTAALTAARHGLSAVLIEKAPLFGGSTARSGGGLWLPGNAVLSTTPPTRTAQPNPLRRNPSLHAAPFDGAGLPATQQAGTGQPAAPQAGTGQAAASQAGATQPAAARGGAPRHSSPVDDAGLPATSRVGSDESAAARGGALRRSSPVDGAGLPAAARVGSDESAAARGGALRRSSPVDGADLPAVARAGTDQLVAGGGGADRTTAAREDNGSSTVASAGTDRFAAARDSADRSTEARDDDGFSAAARDDVGSPPAARDGAGLPAAARDGAAPAATARGGAGRVTTAGDELVGGEPAQGGAVVGGGGIGSGDGAAEYLAHVAGGDVSEARQKAFLAYGPEMLEFVRAQTPLEFAWVPGYPDYHPEAPGGMALGRTIEPRPLDARAAGPDLQDLAPPYLAAPNGMAVTAVDFRWLSLGLRHVRSVSTAGRLAVVTAADRLRKRRRLTMGQALAAGLRAGLRSAGVPVRLGVAMTELIVEDGRVTGIHCGDLVLRARRGVVLASGGFEHNERMRRQFQGIGTSWTVGAAGNTGDGIEAGQRVGGVLDLMDEAWWGPSIPLTSGPYFCLAERNLPGSIIVDGSGRRYVNEATPYVDAVHAMLGPPSHLPSWLITDQTYRDRYVFAGRAPRAQLPRRWFDAGIAHRANTLAELAAGIDVPPEALVSTVERFNDFARSGRDEDYGRGESAYDRYYGDPRQRPNPCLGALRKPPFYAFSLVPGDLGTKGGLRTDEHARVLRADDSPIPGLYAAGNASASVMGRGYAGAGATLGPAMVFGYLAALDMLT